MVYIVVFAVAVAVAGSASAGVVINEVLANEPGGVRALEWIELYNDAPGTARLVFYTLRTVSGGDSTDFLLTGEIPPREYLVLSRDTARFEEHWGDSSGVWGDAETESYGLEQVGFQLPNDSGRVSLLLMSQRSDLAWNEAGEDGHSWERFHPLSDDVVQSVDPSGTTPGLINSITPLAVDLALESVRPSPDSGLTLLAFKIVNRGIASDSTAFLDLYHFDPSRTDSLGQLVASESVGMVDSGFSVILIGQYEFGGVYQPLIARLRVDGDQRPNNNQLVFTAPGADYPPVILSEFLANPTSSWGSEWVELENVGDTSVDLAGWLLGDSIGLVSLSPVERLIYPGEYLVITKDTSDFRIDYPLYAGRLHQPPAWRELNNGSDSVRLFDRFGIQAGGFYYEATFDDNHTWSRSETGEFAGRWGRSEDMGGTPGEENRVRFTPRGTETLGLSIAPRIISPDGDGIDDSTVITIKVSDAAAYTLKLYDSRGRLVRTFEDESPDLSERYVWWGRTAAGDRLPIGIYIVYFEATGVESIKKTVVVAR